MYGLSNVINFANPARQKLIGSAATLVTIDGGPEGVLLKRITSMQEALSCGGLLLYNAANGDWLMYTGATLARVLADSQLGKVPRWGWAAPYADESGLCRIDRLVGAWRPARRYVTNSTSYRENKNFGGVVKKSIILEDYFASGAVIIGLGVVASTTDGFGQKTARTHIPSPAIEAELPLGTPYAMAYMSTEIPLTCTFAEFFATVKTEAMRRVPDNLKEYYEATYAETLSACAFKDLKPTTAVCTYWKNGALWSGALDKPRTVVMSTANGYPTDDSVLIRNGTPAPLRPAASQVEGVQGQAGTYPITVDGRMVLDTLPGAYHLANSGLPLMTGDTMFSTLDKVLIPPTGKIGDLNAGLLRDMHVLKRSLVDGLKFQEDAASHASLAELMTEPVTEFNPTTSIPLALTTDAVNVENFITDTKFAVSHKARSIFARGTLAPMVEAFSDSWDDAAQAYAKANV